MLNGAYVEINVNSIKNATFKNRVCWTKWSSRNSGGHLTRLIFGYHINRIICNMRLSTNFNFDEKNISKKKKKKIVVFSEKISFNA